MHETLDCVCLDPDAPAWELSGQTDYPTLLRALVSLVPETCTLLFEGGFPNDAILEFLTANACTAGAEIAPGTLWPAPRVYHVPGTTKNLEALADLAATCAEPELAVHFHVYEGNRMLLQWFDAFHDPLLLAREFPRVCVEAFAARARMSLRWRCGSESRAK